MSSQPPYSYPNALPYPAPGQPGCPPPSTAWVHQPSAVQCGFQEVPPVTQQPPQNQIPIMEQAAPVQYQAGNCPRGLEDLTQISQILIKQKVEWIEAVLGYETQNEYTILNSTGQDIYKAKEDTDCCTRNFCGSIRPFDMVLKDNLGYEAIHLYRPLNCDSCCFPCCLQKLEVSSPPGTIVGTVEQEWSICKPQFRVKDQNGNVVLCIEGPICTSKCCGDVEFKVLSFDKSTQVGKISKQWSGFLQEAFTDADNFGISFPTDLDVKVKATLIGAAFLIDFMFFEENQWNE